MSDPLDSRNWFVCPQTNSEAKSRLFLFPYAGGGPAAFGKWPAAFPGTVETWIAHSPGRGSRHREPALKRISALVEGLLPAIRPLLEKPFVFFGHSLGGLLAFELALQLRRQGLREPHILFVSACSAPQLSDPHPPIHTLPDSEFLQALQALNGIPSEIANLPELMNLLLPTFRADFEAYENYNYTPDEPPLNFPIIAFGGLDDPRLSREQLEGWDSHTISGLRMKYFPGDHFFIHTAREAVIATIAAQFISTYAAD